MIRGAWGSFGRFLLLTTGIGAIAALGLYVFNSPPVSFSKCWRGWPTFSSFSCLVPGWG
ncbi:hypothetical protein SAMN04489751_2709 [Brevibacterium sandarakinum]|uniref:Uncharacterized protein n=1 Tax=Brevibacterium sandarakinum TaxID=629680 RepID=A0A1H1ULH7_BRESA|nr:hypothetical protein SAMN04489751_2709 [Brevibacterium sandarakinum]